MMSTAASEPPEVLKLLAHDLRWRIVAALARSDRRVQELVAMVGEPANLVSYHLRQLRDARLVSEHRSAADGRDIYYSLDLERLQADFFGAGAALHPALRAEASATTAPTPAAVEVAPTRVLFLCTHNSARSQLAEAITRARAGSVITAYSAGNEPRPIHPLALRVLADIGIDATGLRPKHYDEFVGERFDYVITLCDHIREACPVFQGAPEQLHWSFPDPALAPEADGAQVRAFEQTALQLITRVRFLVPLIAQDTAAAA